MGCSEAGKEALKKEGIGAKTAALLVEVLGYGDPGDLQHIKQEHILMLKLKPIDQSKVEKAVAKAISGISTSSAIGLSGDGALITATQTLKSPSPNFKEKAPSASGSNGGGSGGPNSPAASPSPTAKGSPLSTSTNQQQPPSGSKGRAKPTTTAVQSGGGASPTKKVEAKQAAPVETKSPAAAPDASKKPSRQKDAIPSSLSVEVSSRNINALAEQQQQMMSDDDDDDIVYDADCVLVADIFRYRKFTHSF